MSLNGSMHVRNIYRTPPDFSRLLEQCPEIRPHMVTDLSGKVRFNFQDAAALRLLTCTLLRRDFGLSVHIPEHHLVPTLPGRLNYVLWVEDLMASLQLPQGETIRGLDIGTGPCAVYSLLCARLGWNMLATDSCENSLTFARQNVDANQLQQQIKVLQSSGDSLLSLLSTHGPVHFCMCNPPFFDSSSRPAADSGNHSDGGNAAAGCRGGRSGRLLAASTGLAGEVACVGGERRFVGQLIRESAAHRHLCCVFSTLLGHKSSVRPMRRLIHEAGAVHLASTEFCQGNTKRWGIAWTFDPTARIDTVTPTKQSKKKRAPLQWQVPRHLTGVTYNVPAVKQLVVNWLRSDLQMSVDEGHCNKFYASYKLTAAVNTWTHSRRQRRQQQQLQQLRDVPDAGVDKCDAGGDGSMECEGADGRCSDEEREGGGKREWTVCEEDDQQGGCKRARLEHAWNVCPDLGEQECGVSSSPDSGVSESVGGGVESVGDLGESVVGQEARPVLVFTLFVQAVGGSIFLRLSWLAGRLGWDGVNGVLCWLRHRLLQLVSIDATLEISPHRPSNV